MVQIVPPRWLAHLSIIFCLVLIVTAGAYLRLERLPELMKLGSDTGRDVLIARSVIDQHNIVFEGPFASFGNYHRGPAFYYLIAIPDWLTRGDPLGGAYFSILLDLTAIILLYLLVSTVFNPWTGLVAAAFYSSTAFIVDNARTIWNPNLLPGFALLILLSLVGLTRARPLWLLVLVPTWCIAIQLYESAFLFLPLFAIIGLVYRPRVSGRIWAGALALGGLTLAPYLLYELQDGFYNSRQLIGYVLGFSRNQGAARISLLESAGRLINYFALMLPNSSLPQPLWLITLGAAILYLLAQMRRQSRSPVLILAFFLILPLALVFSPNTLPVRFLTIFFALPVLLAAIGLNLFSFTPWIRAVLSAVVVVIAVQSWSMTWTNYQNVRPGDTAAFTVRQMAELAMETAGGQPFNFQVATASINSTWGYPYRNFFELADANPYGGASFDSFILYDHRSKTEGQDLPGTTLNGARLVHLKPVVIGPNLVQTDRFVPTGVAHLEDGATRLSSRRLEDSSWVQQEFQVRTGENYVISFEYRNELIGGNQYVTFQLLGSNGVTKYPRGVRFQAVPYSHLWKKGALVIEIPDQVTTGRLLLQNAGLGDAWFRSLSLNRVEYEASPLIFSKRGP